MNVFKLLIIMIIFSSCEQVEKYKEDKAIEIVQQAKFGKHNILEKFGIAGYFLDENMTNLEMASLLANKFPDKKFEWLSTKYKGIKKGILKENEYAVCFISEDHEAGILWILNIKNNTIQLYSGE